MQKSELQDFLTDLGARMKSASERGQVAHYISALAKVDP